MSSRRADLLTGAAGVAGTVGGLAVWGSDGATAVPALALGATLAASRRFPRATWAFAALVFLATAIAGDVPGNDFTAFGLIAAHAFVAARWDGWWDGRASLVALVGAGIVSADLGHSAVVPFVFVPVSLWGAGRALRERELTASLLAERARELEHEREAFASLSVRYERARIASELHDIVAHALSVMVVQATAGQRLAAHDPQLTAEAFDSIAAAAREAEGDMGRLIGLLGDDDATGPAPDMALVEELVARAAGSGLDVTLRLEGDREGFPATVAELAYRVAQEGLTNALRYASGAAVSLTLSGDREALVVAVQNAPATSSAALAGSGTGNGLRGLRERAGAAGGNVDAGPTPDGGWRLAARLPRRVAVGPPAADT